MSWWAYLDAALSLPSRRFHQSLTDNNRWIRERSHESYAKNYSVVFPHDEPLAGRNVRKDPLHEVRMRTPTRAALRGTMGRPSQHPCSKKRGGKEQPQLHGSPKQCAAHRVHAARVLGPWTV